MKIKLIKLFFFGILINNFNKIEKLEDLNKIRLFDWDVKVTRNAETKKEIITLLEKLSSDKYIKECSNMTAMLLDGVSKQDPDIRIAMENMLKNSTDFEKTQLQSKISKAAGMLIFKEISIYLGALGSIYYGIQGIKFLAAQYIKPYFDRWGKHREFLAKLNPQKIKELKNEIVGYAEEEKYFARIVRQINEQIKTGKKISMDGCLLYGDPGNGKTARVQKIAYQTQLPLITLNMNDLINSKSGTIEENLTLFFKELRKNSPCIAFFDEIDLLVNSKPEIMSQLLQELDGLQSTKGIFVIAATNHINTLRESLMRPGRFGIHIELKNPSFEDIYLLVDLNLKKLNIMLDHEIDYDAFIHSLNGLSCAGIKAFFEFLLILCKENSTNLITEDFIKETKKLYKIN